MAGRGFLPDPQKASSRAQIPTTLLPSGGRQGPAPKPPAWITLGKAGLGWWRWAWKTPQAAAWDPGALVVLAHRASLEDDLDALEQVKGLDVLAALSADAEGDLAKLLRRLSSLATGRVSILKECRELDGRLGLTPRGFADLRWKIVAEEPEPETAEAVADLDDRRRRLGA